MAFYSTVARYYDAENAGKTDDVELFLSLNEEYSGAVLDVGCGSGRVVLPLAEQGIRVHGIDNNAPMLALAHEKLDANPDAYSTLSLQEGDILTAELPPMRFGMVLLSYNMLMHFHQQPQQIRLLERLRAVIADEGVLVIDLPNSADAYLTPDSDDISLERIFINPQSGNRVMQQAVHSLDRATQFMRITWIYDEILEDGQIRRTIAPTVFRYFFPYEVQLLLRLAGFRVAQMYGDADGTPYEDGCPRMIFLAVPEVEPNG